MKLSRPLTAEQAAERLGLAHTTVRRLIHSGQLPAWRVGSGPKAQFRIDPQAIEAFKAHHAAAAPIADVCDAPGADDVFDPTFY